MIDNTWATCKNFKWLLWTIFEIPRATLLLISWWYYWLTFRFSCCWVVLRCFEPIGKLPVLRYMSFPGGHVQPATQEHQYDPWDQGAGTIGATGELCPCFTSRASGGGIWVCLGGSTWPRVFGEILHESWTKCLKKVVKPQKWVFLKYFLSASWSSWSSSKQKRWNCFGWTPVSSDVYLRLLLHLHGSHNYA